MPRVPVTQTSVRLESDASRVITKHFAPGDDLTVAGRDRVDRILARIFSMSDAEVSATLATTEERFAGRHADLREVFEARYRTIIRHAAEMDEPSQERRLLVGAYFTHEYSVEAAALTNPSMVPAPDQTGLHAGAMRFVLSLRSIGEGHISSVRFRSGVVDASGSVTLDAQGPFLRTATRFPAIYDKGVFRAKLEDLGGLSEGAALVLSQVEDSFTFDALESAIRLLEADVGTGPEVVRTTRTLHWLASSSYRRTFAADSDISERVLFPAAPTESRGMEDARFVRFVRSDGSVVYYAPYTAFDGHEILPQLIETTDFVTFRMSTLNGDSAKNKGIALFPRQINGRYAALSRIDNERNFLMWSDHVRVWEHSEVIQTPAQPWELIQFGNCGSPLETDAGWLVITHGVGPMRQYAIGAILLDKEDPTKVVGHLREPLIEPDAQERDGYVPNVVYSCGSMIAGERLVIPYGYSDAGARVATVRLEELVRALVESR